MTDARYSSWFLSNISRSLWFELVAFQYMKRWASFHPDKALISWNILDQILWHILQIYMFWWHLSTCLLIHKMYHNLFLKIATELLVIQSVTWAFLQWAFTPRRSRCLNLLYCSACRSQIGNAGVFCGRISETLFLREPTFTPYLTALGMAGLSVPKYWPIFRWNGRPRWELFWSPIFFILYVFTFFPDNTE